jgi:hypothetical protein
MMRKGLGDGLADALTGPAYDSYFVGEWVHSHLTTSSSAGLAAAKQKKRPSFVEDSLNRNFCAVH